MQQEAVVYSVNRVGGVSDGILFKCLVVNIMV